jgi:hypothetical protein
LQSKLCHYDIFHLTCVVERIVYFVKYGLTLWRNCFATTVVFELKHFDPSVNQNSRAPVDKKKLRTQKDGCLQTNRGRPGSLRGRDGTVRTSPNWFLLSVPCNPDNRCTKLCRDFQSQRPACPSSASSLAASSASWECALLDDTTMPATSETTRRYRRVRWCM